MAKAALKTVKASATDDTTWQWMQGTTDKERWSTVRIPDGDIHAPFIKRMSKETDGTWTFYVYRNQKCIGCTKDKSTDKGLEAAKKLARSGKMSDAAAKDNAAMLAYVDGKTRDAAEFAKLSKVSQATIANVYPYAMPSNRALEAKGVKHVATTRTDLMGKHEKAAVKSGKWNMDAIIKIVKKGNPKKEGSRQRMRWEICIAHEGKTVRECFAKGGDKYGIEGMLEAGYMQLVDPK
jgi:hypothetical protein